MKQLKNRWIYAIAGIIVLLFAGLVYAWTVLQAPIAATFSEWGKGQLSFTFTLTMTGFCLGGFVGSLLQKSWNPRKIIWMSGVMFLVGFVLVAKMNSLFVLYLGFGILGGAACGLVYNVVMSCMSAWFPDKQGFISGCMLMGFGISSFVVGKIYTVVTPSDGTEVWRKTFLMLGIILFIVMLFAGCIIRKPKEDEKSSFKANKKKDKQVYEEIETRQMLKKTSFWMYMVWATVLSAAGLAIISQGTPIALEACPEMPMSTVATVVGTISISNGIGRLFFGILFDKAGRFVTMLSGGLLFVGALIVLLSALEVNSSNILIVAYIMVGLAYGCVTPTNSAFVNLYYGQKNYPMNLSVVNMNMLVSSIGSTVAGAIYDVTKSYNVIIVIIAVIIAVGTVIGCFIPKPKV